MHEAASSATSAATVIPAPHLSTDAWWVEPALVVLVLGGFSVYATWAALQNAHYYAAPYLSPFYSPCLADDCQHVTLPLVGSLVDPLAGAS